MATESDASDLGSLRPIIIAGLTGIGLGIGGNYAAPERPHTHPELQELEKRRMELLQHLQKIDDDLITLLKNDIRRETLADYWMTRLAQMEKMHTAGKHPHMSNPAR